MLSHTEAFNAAWNVFCSTTSIGYTASGSLKAAAEVLFTAGKIQATGELQRSLQLYELGMLEVLNALRGNASPQ